MRFSGGAWFAFFRRQFGENWFCAHESDVGGGPQGGTVPRTYDVVTYNYNGCVGRCSELRV